MNWKFWKRDDDDLATFEKELGLGRGTGLETEKPVEESYDRLSKPGEPPISFDAPRNEYQRNNAPQQENNDLKLISAKLDTIKAMLDLINQRLNALEKNPDDRPRKVW